MYTKTKAIILKKINWKDSSLIVKFMTEQCGIISAIVQGVKKEKSPFFAHFEYCNVLNIHFLKNNQDKLHKLTNSDIITDRNNIKKSYQQLIAVQSVLDIYSQLIFSEHEYKEFFDLLDTFIDYILKVNNNQMLVIWRFLIALTEKLGFPIVYKQNYNYFVSDKNFFNNRYDDETIEIIELWLDMLPSTANIIKENDILNSSVKAMNQFIFDWMSVQLNKRIFYKTLQKYEELL
jgi:DNA repair protein RecO (recombination protein O)